MLESEKIASVMLLSAFIAILVFWSFSGVFVKEVELSELNESLVNSVVSTTGRVDDVYKNNGNVFMEMGKIKLVIFKSRAVLLPGIDEIKKGDKVMVKGKVEKYFSQLEIVVDSIRKVY